MTISVSMAPDLTAELQPLLDTMKAALETKIQTTGQATQTALTSVKAEVSGVAADVAEVQTDVNGLTTVNGQISTEVQAINQHTDSKLATLKTALNRHTDSALGALAMSPVKNVYRGVWKSHSNGETFITIPTINPNKAVLNITASMVGYAATVGAREAQYTYPYQVYGGSQIYAYIYSATKIALSGALRLGQQNIYTVIPWEIIEYV